MVQNLPSLRILIRNPKKVRAICRRARELDIPLEFNLLGFQEGKHYPDPSFWRVAGEEGCAVILGSDAHEPAAVWDPALIARAEVILKPFGITPIETVKLRPIR